MPKKPLTVLSELRRVVMRHLGRRGLFLLAWGVLFIVYGIGLYFYPLPETKLVAAIWHNAIPRDLRAALWIATGAVAAWSAFRRGPGHDTYGFVALTLMPVVRMSSYGYAWAVSVFTAYGAPRGWVSATFYAVFVTTVILVAGWHEHNGYQPPRRRAARHEGDA